MTVLLGVIVLGGLGAAAWPTGGAGQGERAVPGTYLLTITDAATGEFASKTVMTLHVDGAMNLIDSAQVDIGFTSAQGSWKRGPRRTASGTTLDFASSTDGGIIAKQSFDMTFDGDEVSGEVVLEFYPLEADPLEDDGELIGVFDFRGRGVAP